MQLNHFLQKTCSLAKLLSCVLIADLRQNIVLINTLQAMLLLYSVLQFLALAGNYELILGFTGRNKAYWFLYCQRVYSHYIPGYDLRVFIPTNAIAMATCTAGLVFSALTCLTLRKQDTASNTASNIAKSSIRAIMVMNGGNMGAALLFILYGLYGPRFPFINLMGACGVNMILSALNPLARVYFSSEIRAMIWGKIGRAREVVTSMQLSTI